MTSLSTSPGTEPSGTVPSGLRALEGRSLSLTDQVMAALRSGVDDGTLVPGRLYSAYQLADDLGVSRSPVREALLKLAEAGMVRLERNKGFRIVLPGAREIAEIFHLRLMLEVPAVERAADVATTKLVRQLRAELTAMRAAARGHDEPEFMRHDRRFHELLLEAAGNHRLTQLVNHLRDVTRLLGASTVDRSRSLSDIAAEHRPILDAVAAGDPARAAHEMRAHLEHTGRLLVAQAGPDDAEDLWGEVVQGGRDG
jgi:DNA-binding GntR family transcriptional regulator